MVTTVATLLSGGGIDPILATIVNAKIGNIRRKDEKRGHIVRKTAAEARFSNCQMPHTAFRLL